MGVRSLSHRPLQIGALVVVAFVCMMGYVMMKRADQANPPPPPSKPQASSESMASTIANGKPESGVVPAATTEKKVEIEKQPPIPSGLPNLPLPPAPFTGQQYPPPPVIDDEEARIRMAKLHMLEEAVKSKTGVPISAIQRGSGTGSGRQVTAAELPPKMDPTASYQAKMARIRAELRQGEDEGGGEGEKSKKPGYRDFDKKGEGDRWQMNSKVEAPRSPYELRAGFVIPATLISGINSELPGQIIGQVSHDVYDTATGKWVLVPQGSRLVGTYSSAVEYGQARVLVAWQRIVFPDGKAMDIGAMPGADSAGYSGFNDEVNNHYLRIYGSALLMSAVIAGVSYSQQNGQNSEGGYYAPNAANTMSMALGQQLGRVTAQLIEKNLNVAPTLEIRPGYRFNVVVTKDMTFTKPYQSFDY